MTGNQLSIREHLRGDAFKMKLAEVLPQHCTPDRMAQAALTALTRTPDLAKCDQASFFQCMLQLSQWGLEPDGRFAHLIPFKNNKKRRTECTLIVDYKGLVELAFRSGGVKSIHADVVRAGDLFDYSLGQVKEHIPFFLRGDDGTTKGDPEKIVAAYCVIELRGGSRKCELMSVADIEKVRKRSRASSTGPWLTDWEEMAKKTVFRRASKWIPLSAEVRKAFAYEDREPQNASQGLASDLMARLQPETQQETPAAQSEPETASEGLTWEDQIDAAQSPDEVVAILDELGAADVSDATREMITGYASDRMQQLGKGA